MQVKLKFVLCAGILSALHLTCTNANAQLPTNFPTATITTYDSNAVSDGYVFINSLFPTANSGVYAMIVSNNGTPIWYQSWSNVLLDVKPLANGLLHYVQGNGSGQEGVHKLLDPNYTLVETLNLGNGYAADGHDIEVLPNGNVLVMGYYYLLMDLSRVVPGGYPNAQVKGAIIQELDAQRNVIWQWRSWDYFTFQPDKFAGGANAALNTFHFNAVSMDNDGNVLASDFTDGFILKINRQRGDVIWCLGGPFNQFTFANEDPAQAVKHFTGHCLRRLANGHILLLCNGNAAASRSTKIYEYQLDEVNKVATLVWSYTPASPIYTAVTGSAERLPNGNTFIGWGALAPAGQSPACTEVTPSGQVVFEMKFNDPTQGIYRAFRYPWPPQSQAIRMSQIDLMQGNTYDFGAAGVSLTVTSGGGGYNTLTVTREKYAPIAPTFQLTPPSVLPARVHLQEVAIGSLAANISFNAATFGITNPANITVYYRETTGQGIFIPQTTDYNSVAGTLTVSLSMTAHGDDLGEFVFGYPDLAEIPFPPILNVVENYRGVQLANVVAAPMASTGAVYAVNQQLPICLSWSPKGTGRYYALQIATTINFASPGTDIPYQTEAFYVMTNASPGTTNYYRVKTYNDGGESAWSTGAFQTAAPYIQLTAPNGGEAWRRGLSYFVQWNDNLAEAFKIDLYKAGVFVRNVVSNTPSTGAYKWTVPSSLTPASDYTIQITSMTNNNMTASSTQQFSIVDLPAINAGSTTRLLDGRLQFGVTAPGAATATVLGSTNLTTWQAVQVLTVTNGATVFTDSAPANLPRRFYRVSVP